jgi:hypothetical protein
MWSICVCSIVPVCIVALHGTSSLAHCCLSCHVCMWICTSPSTRLHRKLIIIVITHVHMFARLGRNGTVSDNITRYLISVKWFSMDRPNTVRFQGLFIDFPFHRHVETSHAILPGLMCEMYQNYRSLWLGSYLTEREDNTASYCTKITSGWRNVHVRKLHYFYIAYAFGSF